MVCIVLYEYLKENKLLLTEYEAGFNTSGSIPHQEHLTFVEAKHLYIYYLYFVCNYTHQNPSAIAIPSTNKT